MKYGQFPSNAPLRLVCMLFVLLICAGMHHPQVHHSTVQERREGRMTSLYTLEVSGPVLPYHVRELCSLVKVTQSGNFNMTSSTAVTVKLPTASKC